MLKPIAVALAVSLLAGCATTPWPVAPDYDREKLINKNKALTPMTLERARALAAAYASTLDEAANDRARTELVANELLYYGTLVFALGSALLTKHPDSTSALRTRNVGGVTAFSSSLFGGHYKLAEQQAAFQKAARRMRCAIEAIEPIRPDVRERMGTADLNALDAQVTNPSFRDRMTGVPNRMTNFIEQQVVPDLRASLQAITLSQPSREEFAAAIDNWRKDKDTGGDAHVAAPVNVALLRSNHLLVAADVAKTDAQLSDEDHAYVVAVTAFSSALTTCIAAP